MMGSYRNTRRTPKFYAVIIAIALAMILACWGLSAAVGTANAHAAPYNRCDNEGFFRTHLDYCQDGYVDLPPWYFWSGSYSHYTVYVYDDPDHPRYHPAGYYHSARFQNSRFYKSGTWTSHYGVSYSKSGSYSSRSGWKGGSPSSRGNNGWKGGGSKGGSGGSRGGSGGFHGGGHGR